jgi:alkylhydroperoxidase family enzyme
MPRVEPIPREQWSNEMVDALSAMHPPTARYFVPPPGGRPERPKASSVMGTLAYHPDLTKAFFSFNGHILYGTTLSMRQREILALRLAAVRKSAYLWAQHLVHTEDAALSDMDVSRIAFGPEAPFLDPLERALLHAVDELVSDGVISPETWAAMDADLSTQQILDVIFTVGCYDIVAWVCGSFEFELEGDLPNT